MKQKIQNLIGMVKSRPKTSVALLLVIIAIIFIIRGGKSQIEQISVVRGSVNAEVAVTGKTVSVHDVNLGFEKTGTIASTPVSVGSRVKEGELLVSLNNSELRADLAKAEATVREEMVKLSTIKTGSTNEYSDARVNMIAEIEDAYVKSDDALRNKIDQFFENPRAGNTRIEFSILDDDRKYIFSVDTSLRVKINDERYKLELLLTSWKESLTKLKTLSSGQNIDSYVIEAENNLNRIKDFIDMVALAVNSIEIEIEDHRDTVEEYKSDVSNIRTIIATAISDLISAKEKLTAAPQQNSSLLFNDVLSQEARVGQYQAQVDAVRAQLEKTIIRSPIDGIVTKQDAEVGEIVSPGVNLVSVISDAEMEIEADVSEVNIGKIAIGNIVSITFDAFPDTVYQGEIFYIEPAETIVDDVVNYKVKIKIIGDVIGLKSGLTANLRIKSASKENVLSVPQYAITVRDGKSYVQKVLDNGEVEEVTVTTGLVGSDGMVEISSGLSQGDTINVTLK